MMISLICGDAKHWVSGENCSQKCSGGERLGGGGLRIVFTSYLIFIWSTEKYDPPPPPLDN